MKRTIQFFALFLLFLGKITGQTPWFQTTLYFHDAVGHKDSLVLGLDPNDDGSLQQFGEVYAQGAVDSVFEVRAMDFNEGFMPSRDFCPTYKKLIVKVAGSLSDCYYGNFPVILVKAKYQPVTISWKRSDFNQPCNEHTFITPDESYFYLNPEDWKLQPEAVWWCVSKSDSLTEDLNASFFGQPMQTVRPVKGGVLDTIPCFVLHMHPSQFTSPCELIAVFDNASVPSYAGSISPNPSASGFRLENKRDIDIVAVQIVDVSGVLQKSYAIPSPTKDDIFTLSHLPEGVYFVEITWTDGRRLVKKWIKQAAR